MVLQYKYKHTRGVEIFYFPLAVDTSCSVASACCFFHTRVCFPLEFPRNKVSSFEAHCIGEEMHACFREGLQPYRML